MLSSTSETLIAGRYALVRQLAVGGMAEVWLARQRGLEGFEKLVVVKRILPHLANDPDFVQMFLDEARTAADLRHSNVASVTDVGTEAGAYFIAMEYLHGQDLMHIVQRCKANSERIPLPHVLQMVSDAAQGLDYAHRKVDLYGTPQKIVHRDVSPQNVLVTYEGSTKLLDFGIASGSHRSTQTDAGVVKGKYAYMSPEQFEGGTLDARSDLFSLGVVLWELVTMQRLFWKSSDAETLRAVMECKVPRPSRIQPDCPLELEELILHALAYEPAGRFASCSDFAHAIDDLLENLRLSHSPSRVGSWLRGIFPEHSLDPTGIPAVAPSAPNAATRNEKLGRKEYPGSKTQRAPSREPRPSAPTGESRRPRLHLVPTPNPFFGRPAELAQLATHFGEKARLVTITGVAGQGKSRLASQFVELHCEPGKGKVWTIELAEAKSAEELITAVTTACGLEQDRASATPAQLIHEAGRRLSTLGPALIVLKGFELHPQVIQQWLEAAPQLSLLVTRRERLALRDERVLSLSGLAESQAVALFLSQLERGGGQVPSSGPEREQVAQICRLLHGHPLAIELVAARSDGSNLDALRQQLSSGAAASLDATIAWTCDQLPKPEQQALAGLSVFRGGFTVETAEAILEADEATVVLDALVRKSLLQAYVAPAAPGRFRFRLSQSIRAHAEASLQTFGTADTVRARHAECLLRLSDAWAEEVHSRDAADRMALLAVEAGNLRRIFEDAQATQPPTAESTAIALNALHGLDPALTHRGPYGTHLALLEVAIEAAARTGAKKATLARAMQERANGQRIRGQLDPAIAGLADALKLVRAGEDLRLEGRILFDQAQARFVGGEVDAAITSLEKSLLIAGAVGDPAFEVKALALQAMAYVARRELTKALACCDKALPLARGRADAVSEARVLGTVGSLFLEERRTELARAFFSDAVARCEQADEPALKGYFLGKLAQVLAECGDFEEARQKVAEALKLLEAAGDLRHQGLFLSFSAWLEALAGQRKAAKLALSAASALLEGAKDPLLLTAQSLRRMQLRFMHHEVPPDEARALLESVQTGQGEARPAVARSEEVRLAAIQLERTLRAPFSSTYGAPS